MVTVLLASKSISSEENTALDLLEADTRLVVLVSPLVLLCSSPVDVSGFVMTNVVTEEASKSSISFLLRFEAKESTFSEARISGKTRSNLASNGSTVSTTILGSGTGGKDLLMGDWSLFICLDLRNETWPKLLVERIGVESPLSSKQVADNLRNGVKDFDLCLLVGNGGKLSEDSGFIFSVVGRLNSQSSNLDLAILRRM